MSEQEEPNKQDAEENAGTMDEQEQKRSIDFLRASDVIGAEGWEGGEPRLNSQDEKRGHGWGLKGNAGLGPKGYRRSDDSIKDDVCERLTQDPVIDATEIEVEVKDGEVILSGSVAGRIEKSRAADILVEIRGVKNIVNRLTVEGPSQTPRDDDASVSHAGAT